MDGPAAAPGTDGTPEAAARGLDVDVLVDLRIELEQVDDIAVQDRVVLFDRANATLAAELAALDAV